MARNQRVFAISLIAVILGFVVVLQIRSQDQVTRSLATQDDTSVALLINDLNKANAQLLQQTVALAQRQVALQQALDSGGTDTRALDREVMILGVVSGTVPAHGPGIQMRVDGPVQDFEIQDALNDLRNAGAEALALNGYRLIAGTPVVTKGQTLTVDGHPVNAPFVLQAIGDPVQLDSAASISASSLQTRVQVSIEQVNDLAITEVVSPHPLIYAQLGG